MNPVSTLVAIPLFGGLSKDRASELADASRLQRFEPEQQVIAEGEAGHTMFVILRGRVAVSRVNEQGNRIVFHELGPGEFFGEMSLLASTKRTADVFAIKPTQLMVIEKDAFIRCVLSSPDVAMRIVTHLCRRIRQGDSARIARRNVRQRLIDTLLLLAEKPEGADPKSDTVVLEISKTALGERILACRETVSRELSQLAREKYLRMNGKLIVIPKPDRLQDLAD